ncbi:hypothetical protein BHM03_00023560 [Ensete ventricosum]|nr:hypothetical protein BHM03_00023560 [Ensete ventricosum]
MGIALQRQQRISLFHRNNAKLKLWQRRCRNRGDKRAREMKIKAFRHASSPTHSSVGIRCTCLLIRDIDCDYFKDIIIRCRCRCRSQKVALLRSICGGAIRRVLSSCVFREGFCNFTPDSSLLPPPSSLLRLMPSQPPTTKAYDIYQLMERGEKSQQVLILYGRFDD